MSLSLQLLDPTTQEVLDSLDASPLVTQLEAILGINLEERFPAVALIAPANYNLDDLIIGLDMLDARLNSLVQRESISQPVEQPISELSEQERNGLPTHQSLTRNDISYVAYTKVVVQENNTYSPVQAQLQTLEAFLKECRNKQALLRNLAY